MSRNSSYTEVSTWQRLKHHFSMRSMNSIVQYPLKNHLNDIFNWLCCNWLTLNLNKTKYVIFQPRQKANYNLHSPLVLAGQILQQPQSVKYLGVYIDCHLCWNDHIDYLCCKILSRNLNIIIRLKCYLMSNSLVAVYYSLIYPYLYYGCLLWGNNYDAPLSKVVKLQNKAVRIGCSPYGINNPSLRSFAFIETSRYS